MHLHRPVARTRLARREHGRSGDHRLHDAGAARRGTHPPHPQPAVRQRRAGHRRDRLCRPRFPSRGVRGGSERFRPEPDRSFRVPDAGAQPAAARRPPAADPRPRPGARTGAEADRGIARPGAARQPRAPGAGDRHHPRHDQRERHRRPLHLRQRLSCRAARRPRRPAERGRGKRPAGPAGARLGPAAAGVRGRRHPAE